MSNDLKLRVLFDMVDSMTKPLKNILSGNKDVAKSLKATRDQMKELGKAQKDVGTFREMHAGLRGTSGELAAAQGRIKSLADTMRANGPPTKAMVRDFERAKQAAAQLKTTHEKQSTQLQELRGRLSGAGIDTRNLAQHERELRTNIIATTAAMNAQQNKLAEISAREKKIAGARAKMNAAQGTAANMAVTGYAARSAGTTIMGDIKDTLGEAKKFETDAQRIRALGLGEHAAADAVKYSRAMKSYGVSATDNVSIVRDAMTIFADEHHAKMVAPTLAKMKFGNEAMFGGEDGHANEEKFMNMLKVIELRGGTKNEATFKDEANMVQKVITATGGRVGPEQWMQFIQTGGVAAKQMRKDAFFNQMEPLIQEMGGHSVGTGMMSAYSNVYQGKTTVRAAKQLQALDLLDPTKVEYNKIGMLKQFKPGALAGGELFKASPFEWMQKVLLPKMAAKGITDPDKVKDMIATIFSNRTASNLFTTMYMQQDQIKKSANLSAHADGIEEIFDKGKNMTAGRELDALAKMRDLKLELGEKVMPLYNSALSAGAAILDSVNGFMKEHSTAATAIITTLTILAALMVAVGSLTIVLAGVLGPIAAIKFGMTALGMQGGIMANVFRMAVAPLRMAASAVLFLGRALLMNPIGLAITAIAVAALLIYQYWEPIKAFFGGLWDQIKTAFDGGLAGIGALILNWSPLGLFYQGFAALMSWFGVDMPAKFTTFGANMLDGLVNGITSRLGAVKDAIVGAGESAVAWFKEKLGIHSPSRVFGELGGFISQGAAIGIESEQGKVAKASFALAMAASAAFGAPALAQAGQLGAMFSQGGPLVSNQVPIDSRGSVLASQGGAAGAPGGASYQIAIHAAPGMDPAAIARAVSAELDRRERSKLSRIGSRLTD